MTNRSLRFGAHNHQCGPFCASLPSAGLGRRGLLGAAAATLAAPTIARAASVPPVIARKQIIDVHHHFVPPDYLKLAGSAMNASGALSFPPYAKWTPQATLAEMDRGNVGTAILSISTPGIWFGDVAQARELSRICNDYAAKMQADFPGRFAQFAEIPLPDAEGSIAEMAHGIDTLGALGVALMTSYPIPGAADLYLGDQRFWPVYEELNRRGAIAYVHPNTPGCCNKIADSVNPSFIEFPTDSTRTILSLLYNGVFTRFPRIRWIFSHNGGTLPMLLARVMQLGHAPGDAARVKPDDIPAIVRGLYFECANAAHPAPMGAIRQWADPTHLMFGSDYPYVGVLDTESLLLKDGLEPKLLQAVLRDNALKLMPGLAALTHKG